MSDLTDFLLARIAKDYDAAEDWHGFDCSAVQEGSQHGPCDCGGPERWRAECEAKRLIVAEHSEIDPCDWHDAMLRSIPCPTLLHLVAVYDHHPDCRDEWRL